MSAASSGRTPIAPFQVVLVPLNLQKSARVREVTDRLYAELTAAGIEVLYDDRDARPGVKFADAELLGIPHRAGGGASAAWRRAGSSTATAATAPAPSFPPDEALAFMRARLGAERPRAARRPRCRACWPAARRAAAAPRAPTSSATRSCRRVVAQGDRAGAVLHRPVRLGGVVHADGAAAAAARQRAGRAAGHPQAGVLRDPSQRRGAPAAGARHGGDRGGEPLRSLGGLLAPARSGSCR